MTTKSEVIENKSTTSFSPSSIVIGDLTKAIILCTDDICGDRDYFSGVVITQGTSSLPRIGHRNQFLRSNFRNFTGKVILSSE